MKLYPVAAATIAGALVLSGCSSSSSDNGGSASGGGGEKKTVTLWMYPVIADEARSKQFWADTEKAFEEKNGNVDLKIELQPWADRDAKIATALASGKGPDLVVLGPDQILQYQATGGLKSLKSVAEEGKDAFLPSAVDAAKVKDEIYAVPIYHTVTTLAYNKKLLNEAGVTEAPKTWEDLKAAAPKLAAKGAAVLDYSGKPTVTLNQTFYPLLWQAGGSVFAEDGKKVAFNSDEGKAALQFLVDMKGAKGIPADASTKENLVEGGALGTGKAAMGMSMTKAEIQTFGKAVGADNVVAAMPLKGKEQVTFGLPGLLARTSIGKDEQSVKAVASFLASPDQQVKLAKASGFFPARSDAKLDSTGQTDTVLQEALKKAKPGEPNVKARQVMTVLAAQIQAALNGSKSVDQALSDAEKEANAQMAK